MRQPPAKVKNRQIAFVFCFGLPSVWERSTKLRIHRSHSCNFFYRSYSRILAPYCNSSHITKAIAIGWGVKSSLYKCYMITYPSVLRSPSVFRVWAAIPSEYMALSQTFSVTSHMDTLYGSIRRKKTPVEFHPQHTTSSSKAGAVPRGRLEQLEAETWSRVQFL